MCFLEKWRYVRPDLLSSSAVNPALHGPFQAPVNLITDPYAASIVPALPPPPQLYRPPGALVLEIACGTASASRYHLQVDPHAQVIAVDILPYETVISFIPPEQRHRFHYLQLDYSALTFERLTVEVQQRWGVPLTAISHVHFSPPCETFSRATHGQTHHRGSDCNPLTDLAKQHDRALAVAVNTITQLVNVHPAVFVSLENPVGMFRKHPLIRALREQPKWQFVRADHCSHTSPLLDGDRVFPNKPSHWLVYNLNESVEFKRCRRD